MTKTFLVAFLLMAAPAFAKFPTVTIAQVTRSLVHVVPTFDEEGMDGEPLTGTCTGFQVATHLILTDFHCVSRQESGIALRVDVDDVQASIVGIEPGRDMALLMTTTPDKPFVKWRIASHLAQDEQVWALGYGLGFDRPISTSHTVWQQRYQPIGKHFPQGLFLRETFIHGQSGGPIFDRQGRVVGIIQQSYERASYGQDVEHILAFINGFMRSLKDVGPTVHIK